MKAPMSTAVYALSVFWTEIRKALNFTTPKDIQHERERCKERMDDLAHCWSHMDHCSRFYLDTLQPMIRETSNQYKRVLGMKDHLEKVDPAWHEVVIQCLVGFARNAQELEAEYQVLRERWKVLNTRHQESTDRSSAPGNVSTVSFGKRGINNGRENAQVLLNVQDAYELLYVESQRAIHLKKDAQLLHSDMQALYLKAGRAHETLIKIDETNTSDLKPLAP